MSTSAVSRRAATPSQDLPLSGQAGSPSRTERLHAHLAIARLDHSIKNLLVLPGILVPLSLAPELRRAPMWGTLIAGFIAVTLITCSNYVINEFLDAPFDRLHPTKKMRPAARGLVSSPLVYIQWIAMMLVGMYIAIHISTPFAITTCTLWIMGCLYNIRPFRTKDIVYLDVLSESVNSPLRLLLGWFMVTSTIVPPVSLLLSYWMVGCYFMALKRFSELREISHKTNAALYRPSFGRYTERSLLGSVTFYASAGMLFFGAFVMRYRLELILSFPLIAFLMAEYFNLAFEVNSPVQNPEKLYRQPRLLVSLAATVVMMGVLLQLSIPALVRAFPPTAPFERVETTQ